MHESRRLRLLNPGLFEDAISVVDINVEWDETLTEQWTTNFKQAGVVLVETVYIHQEGFHVFPRILCSSLLQEPDDSIH
jgi:hypothetical protein